MKHNFVPFTFLSTVLNAKTGKESDSSSNSKENTDKEIELEIEECKAELERKFRAKIKKKAENEMKEVIWERVLKKEQAKLEQEEANVKAMVDMFEDKEREWNGEASSDAEERNPRDSGLWSYSDHVEGRTGELKWDHKLLLISSVSHIVFWCYYPHTLKCSVYSRLVRESPKLWNKLGPPILGPYMPQRMRFQKETEFEDLLLSPQSNIFLVKFKTH